MLAFPISIRYYLSLSLVQLKLENSTNTIVIQIRLLPFLTTLDYAHYIRAVQFHRMRFSTLSGFHYSVFFACPCSLESRTRCDIVRSFSTGPAHFLSSFFFLFCIDRGFFFFRSLCCCPFSRSRFALPPSCPVASFDFAAVLVEERWLVDIGDIHTQTTDTRTHTLLDKSHQIANSTLFGSSLSAVFGFWFRFLVLETATRSDPITRR